jgi:hypothetical protein
VSPLGTCDYCARLVPLTPFGTVKRYTTVGPLLRARTGKRRRRCPGSGRLPREASR